MSESGPYELTPLPRGGILVRTSEGPVQFGVPPETIKDTMGMAEGVPAIFIVPQFLFFLRGGISLAEMEFPIYYNFFMKQRPIRVVCTEFQKKRLQTVLAEALFGPNLLDEREARRFIDEFVHGRETPGFPDIQAEVLNFKTLPVQGTMKVLEMEDVVEFITFDDRGLAHIGAVEVELQMDGNFDYTIRDGGQVVAEILRQTPLAPAVRTDYETELVFRPPLFGVTTLGAGHGFDPSASTSGMIIWVNHRGIMVDPPVNSARDLLRLGVNPKLLGSIILTHCHADHDAGTLQKIMQEGTVTLYTTGTIFRSFIRKSAALTGIDEVRMAKLVHHVPLTIGAPMTINGGTFRFNYTFHSVPTIAIQAEYLGKSMVYSSDTCNDPAYLDEACRRGVLSTKRRDFLKNFPWHRDVIFHEAGIEPLHTPLAFLQNLPEEVRRRIYIVHVTRGNIPKGSGLRVAPTGLSNTLELDVAAPPLAEAVELLSLFMDVPIFKTLGVDKAMEFLSIVRQEEHAAGTLVFRKGDQADAFFIVMSGQVDIVDGETLLTTLSNGDYFGEKCLFGDSHRTAAARARSETRLIRIEREPMQVFMRGTDLEASLAHLALCLDKSLRDIMEKNEIFSHLTPSQETELIQLVRRVDTPLQAGAVILAEEQENDACYLIHEGEVDVYRKNVRVARLGPGDLIGVGTLFQPSSLSPYTFVAQGQPELYCIQRQAFRDFVEKNPGVLVWIYFQEF